MKNPATFHIGGDFYRLDELVVQSRIRAEDPTLPEWEREVFRFIHWFLFPGAGELFQETSGTTGEPKSFRLNREKMILSARRTIGYFGLRARDRVLLCLPVRYIAGKMMVVRALVGELDLLIQESSGRPLRDLSEQVDFTAMVPLQVYESLQNGDDFSKIRQLVIGGGEVHPETRIRLKSMEIPEVYESFAMTETYTHFALKRINGEKPDEYFRLLEGVKVEMDPRGCLVVDFPGISRIPVVTNDLVEIHDRMDGFRWLGRHDNMINSGGIKIIPELLERKFESITGFPCLVLPEPDIKLGQKLVLLIESGNPDLDMEVWRSRFRSELPRHEVPKRIVRVESIPRNQSYKPDRQAARVLL